MTQALMGLWKQTPLIYSSSTLQASNSRYVPSVSLNSYLLSVMGRSRIDGVRDVPVKPDASVGRGGLLGGLIVGCKRAGWDDGV